eukprot:TRINITY_DN4485_c0_g1_i2.p1 TRINITY_DN4485_c0_g1~~TRINITY_DN4485_c0_g1_i2.p1  ORF type:complete len:620 (+),score=127.62 TRINITY_DN4485_c0_g1_i2:88-1860(+)
MFHKADDGSPSSGAFTSVIDVVEPVAEGQVDAKMVSEIEMHKMSSAGAASTGTKPAVDEDIAKSGEGELGAKTLAAGGEVNIFELRNSGFLMQYFAVGVIYGGLPSTVYGFFLGYLNVPGYVYATAGVVTSLPWSFKFFFGLMNDCLPICNYRRKPYMVFGWALCFAVLVVLSLRPLPEPYYCRHPETGQYLKDQICNEAAKWEGGSFAILMCVAALGYVIADVAADGLMVEYAQREPEERRGSTQTTIYLVRTLGSVASVALVGFGMNGKEYNGTFDISLSFNQIMGIIAIPAGFMVPISWYLVNEQPIERGQRKSLRAYSKMAWELLTSKAFFVVVMYQFWEPFIGRISTTAGGLVKSEWAGVKNLQNQLFSLVSLFVFSFGLWQVKKRFLGYSWRMMLLCTAVFLNVMDAGLAMLTIYDVVRNQYFYLGETILDEIPAAANFVVGTFIIVEMADKGNEGLTYGLLTTISNLGTPFSRAVGNQIFGLFSPNLSDSANYEADTPQFRNTVALSFALSYFFSFVSLFFLLLIPDQKKEAQRRKNEWSKREAFGYITVSLVVFALSYSLTVNFMTMIPDTACLQFVGGSGC